MGGGSLFDDDEAVAPQKPSVLETPHVQHPGVPIPVRPAGAILTVFIPSATHVRPVTWSTNSSAVAVVSLYDAGGRLCNVLSTPPCSFSSSKFPSWSAKLSFHVSGSFLLTAAELCQPHMLLPLVPGAKPYMTVEVLCSTCPNATTSTSAGIATILIPSLDDALPSDGGRKVTIDADFPLESSSASLTSIADGWKAKEGESFVTVQLEVFFPSCDPNQGTEGGLPPGASDPHPVFFASMHAGEGSAEGAVDSTAGEFGMLSLSASSSASSSNSSSSSSSSSTSSEGDPSSHGPCSCHRHEEGMKEWEGSCSRKERRKREERKEEKKQRWIVKKERKREEKAMKKERKQQKEEEKREARKQRREIKKERKAEKREEKKVAKEQRRSLRSNHVQDAPV